MKVTNIHTRIIDQPMSEVGELLNSLSSNNDRLWAHEKWPAMRFDRELGVGAIGGHGPIRYLVSVFDPGRKIEFTFTGPAGFHGGHRLELSALGEAQTEIKHSIDMRVSGPALFTWPVIFRPLHDALIEDSFDKAQHLSDSEASQWSPWVKFLRRLLKKKKRTRQG